MCRTLRLLTGADKIPVWGNYHKRLYKGNEQHALRNDQAPGAAEQHALRNDQAPGAALPP